MLVLVTPFFVIPIGLALYGQRPGGAVAIGFAVGIAVAVVAGIVAQAVFVPIWAVIAHAILRLTGGTAWPLRRTIHAIGYGAGANVVTGVPCIGGYVGWIWWVISSALMLRTGQRVHGARAAVAAALPPLLVLGAVMGIGLALTTGFPQSVSVTTSPAPASPAVQTKTIVQALSSYPGRHNGAWPRHAIELTADRTSAVMPSNLVIGASTARMQFVPVGGITLDAYSFLSADKRPAIEQAAIGLLPQDTVAHRLGDFVFTWHGMPYPPPSPRLWTVICATEDGPANHAAEAADGLILAADASGTIRSYTIDVFPTILAKQNQLRARHNLPPLPDPASVTHARPAVAPRTETNPAAAP